MNDKLRIEKYVIRKIQKNSFIQYEYSFTYMVAVVFQLETLFGFYFGYNMH